MLVIFNAKIHTLDPLNSSASALAIDHEKVIAVGKDHEILSTYSSTRSLNADGRTIIPGLTDAHIHLEDFSLSLQKVDCETPSRQECLQRVAAQALVTPPGEWVLGHGWNQNNWPEGYGSATLLDEFTPNNPVYMTHKSLHSAWVNTAALQRAGITRDTPDPTGGRISHRPDGEPDGILIESACDLLANTIPQPTFEQVMRAIEDSIPILWRMGVTGVHDFDGFRCFTALQTLHNRQELRLRVMKGIPLEGLAHAVGLGLHSGFGDDMLRIGPVKMFADGALGPHTAAMQQPYDEDPTNSGILMMDADAIYDQGRLAVENGINMAVHAIGDRANHEVLNGYTQLRELEHSLPSKSRYPLRHRIEHVQILQPEDLPRFAKLNIIASMQPIHATSDMLMADRYWGKRSAYAYAWHSLSSRQTSLAFGSDAPVESPNPFCGIHAAVTRRRADGTSSPRGWYPEQCLTVDEAIHAYTFGAAIAAGVENRLGRLIPGNLADLLVLNEDPYSCEPEMLLTIHPIATMVGGEWVYSELE